MTKTMLDAGDGVPCRREPFLEPRHRVEQDVELVRDLMIVEQRPGSVDAVQLAKEDVCHESPTRLLQNKIIS